MGENPEFMIKKAISETIVEELLRDCGFFVLRLGQEYTMQPLGQLESFIKECKGSFKLNRNDKDEILNISYIKKLPDFLIIDKKGETYFIEVKYRKDARLSEKDVEVFEFYPSTFMIIVNSEVSQDFLMAYGKKKEEIEVGELSDQLFKTRFHVHIFIESEDKSEGENNCYISKFDIATLQDWLKEEFELDASQIIEKYEKLVTKWLNK